MERRQSAPHTAARTAVVWAALRRQVAPAAEAGRQFNIVDVGGGTGGFAVPLAEIGHRVTVVDSSPDALAALTRRAEEAGVAELITAVQGDADGLAFLVPAGAADLVLCHSVLEVVDGPAEVAGALASALRHGGLASVIVASRAGAFLAKVVTGQLDVAATLLTDPDGRAGPRDPLRRRFDAQTAADLLTKAGLTVEDVHGVRVVTDLVPGLLSEREHDALVSLELAAATRTPYKDFATQLHLLARRP